MEKFQALCDKGTGHDPFRPLGPVFEASLGTVIAYTVFCMVQWIGMILSLPVKLVAVLVCSPFGVDTQELNFRLSRFFIWRPLAWLLGVHVTFFVNLLSKKETPSVVNGSLYSSDITLHKQSVILSILTSPSDILAWVNVMPSRCIFAFGIVDGGFLLIDTVKDAFDLSMDPSSIHVPTAKKLGQNTTLTNHYCGRFFSTLPSLIHYCQKYQAGPIIIFPQTQRSNGSALVPWAESLSIPNCQSFETSLFRGLRRHEHTTQNPIEAVKESSDDLKAMATFIAVPVFTQSGVTLPHTVLSPREYIAQQILTRSKCISIALSRPSEHNQMLVPALSKDTLRDYEIAVGQVQQKLYSLTNVELSRREEDAGSAIVSKTARLHSCKDVRPDALEEYRDLYRSDRGMDQ